MKSLISQVVFGMMFSLSVILMLVSFADAAPSKATSGNAAKTGLSGKKQKAVASSSDDAKKGRDFQFGDLVVKGKYLYANEGIATVEDEKNLDDLLGVRMDFKDRAKKAAQRR